jgi:hypothetical protein
MCLRKKSAQIREILISESVWENDLLIRTFLDMRLINFRAIIG